MKSILWAALAVGASACLSACAGASSTPETTETTAATSSSPSSGEPTTFQEQAAAGQKLYGDNCSKCHGAAGEGGQAPRLVGLDKGALPLDPPSGAKARTAQFKTAADVATFVVKNMPPGAGGSLKESEYWSILACDLHANGVDLPQKLDGSNAGTVTLHK